MGFAEAVKSLHHARGKGRPAKPYLMTLTGGRTYLWCRCGRSAKQPLCDGSHKGTGFEPIRYVAAADGEEVLFCGCKQTSTPPFCDGTHSNLPGGSPTRSGDPENRAVPRVTERSGARRLLNGSCYVLASVASMRTRPRIASGSPRAAALHQNTMFLRVARPPVMSFGTSDTILFVVAGSGTVTISGRPSSSQRRTGFRRADPARGCARFADSRSSRRLRRVPTSNGFEHMPQQFDASRPQRVVSGGSGTARAHGGALFRIHRDDGAACSWRRIAAACARSIRCRHAAKSSR